MAPKTQLFLALLERLKTKAPSMRMICEDLGQLENYKIKPPVSFPCSLISFDEVEFTDTVGQLIQMGLGFIDIRVGLIKFTDFSNLTPDQWNTKSLDGFEAEQEVFKALHNWAPEGWGKMLRRSSKKEKRDDDIKVQIIRFEISHKDVSAVPQKTTVPRPGALIHNQTK